MDTKISKTKLRLVYALNHLMKQESFSKISVNDLCTEAMIGRSTFYDHFMDKYDLLECALDYLLEQLLAYEKTLSLRETIEALLGLIYEQRQLFNNLLSSKMDWEAIQLVRKVWNQALQASIIENVDSVFPPKVSAKLRAHFLGGGFASVVMDWIETGYETPKEELAESMLVLLNVKEG